MACNDFLRWRLMISIPTIMPLFSYTIWVKLMIANPIKQPIKGILLKMLWEIEVSNFMFSRSFISFYRVFWIFYVKTFPQLYSFMYFIPAMSYAVWEIRSSLCMFTLFLSLTEMFTIIMDSGTIQMITPITTDPAHPNFRIMRIEQVIT